MFGVSYHWYGKALDTGMRPRRICSRCDQWPKLGNVTIASRPTRSISATIASTRRIACSVCDRITTSNAASSNPASPRSRSLWMTLMPLRTLASTPASSISMP